MPGIRINLAGVTTDEFAAVPEGRYRVRVFNCEQKRSKPKPDGGGNNRYLNWELKIEEPSDFAGRRLWHMTMLEPENALFNLKGFLLGLGVSEEDMANEDFEFEPTDYYGKLLVVTVKHREYDGKPRANITRVYPGDTEIGLDNDLDFETAAVPSGGSNI